MGRRVSIEYRAPIASLAIHHIPTDVCLTAVGNEQAKQRTGTPPYKPNQLANVEVQQPKALALKSPNILPRLAGASGEEGRTIAATNSCAAVKAPTQQRHTTIDTKQRTFCSGKHHTAGAQNPAVLCVQYASVHVVVC